MTLKPFHIQPPLLQMSRLTSTTLEEWGVDEYNEALPYARLRMSYLCPASHDDDEDIGIQVHRHLRHLLAKDVTAVRLGALARNPDDVLELALRCVVERFFHCLDGPLT